MEEQRPIIQIFAATDRERALHLAVESASGSTTVVCIAESSSLYEAKYLPTLHKGFLATKDSKVLRLIGKKTLSVIDYQGLKKMLRANNLPKNFIFTEIESQIEYPESVIDLLKWCAGLSLKHGSKITWLLRLMSSDEHIALDRILNSAEISQAGWWSEQLDRQTYCYSIFPSALVKGSKAKIRKHESKVFHNA